MLDIFLAEDNLVKPEVSHQDPGEVQTFVEIAKNGSLALMCSKQLNHPFR